MKSIKILYIHPYEFWGTTDILPSFIRISNYLNSRRKELNGSIKEKYLDFRYENLPEFAPENIVLYRFELKKLLTKIYKRFKFNLVAISCYGSFNYINSIEVAFLIKYFINPNCTIVVGGVHTTICPQDFQPGEFPVYLNNTYNQNTTPFDFLIKEEGEKPFFKLVRDILEGSIKRRNNPTENCIIREIEIINDLNELPIIDLRLLKKYRKILKKYNNLWIDFSRGCIFKCKFCINSENYVNCYKKVRTKSVKKCIEELKVLKNCKWLSIKNVFISDMIFLPKKSLRTQFFEELKKIINQEGSFPFQITIMDRIDLCSMDDLANYNELNIIPSFGLESCSKTMLYKMGKILGRTRNQINNGINRYLLKLEEIIKEGNKLELLIKYNLLIGLPGSTKETIKENCDFFLKKRFDGESLLDKFKVIFKFNKYFAYIGSEIYNIAEEKFGARIYHKEWWKMFRKDQAYLAALVDPSKDLTFKESINLNLKFIKEVFIKQNKLKNPVYSFSILRDFLRSKDGLIYKLHEMIKEKNSN